ncbi:cytochrome b/b6 domain-containing protein [Thiospirillum jenense]|uniref:Cytochrome b/b6 domain-containing protein n=1 Tax=Thiospirillum jenense TaxID=1653858 RepID=A0A839HG63_9GAMM|nr:cytochrome b/b6 domain-containing protein [Thiospirillum jenense]MBB1126138.1 cytochrome b/b6 domain-containing protein [Thiospirillum jenense]
MTGLYLYARWLRVWHWLNALLFMVLIVSGVSMHFGGSALLMPFNTAVTVHNTAGILLSVTWLGFMIGNAVTTNKRHYRVTWRGLPQRLFAQMRYYGYGIFHNAPHPFHVTADMKLNTLQQLSYLGVMYGLMPILVMSGWAFLFSTFLPDTLFGIGSVWFVAMIHLTVAYGLALFLLVHSYIITTGDTLTSNLRAMITGWHPFTPPLERSFDHAAETIPPKTADQRS